MSLCRGDGSGVPNPSWAPFEAQGIPHDLDIMYELWRVPKSLRSSAIVGAAGLVFRVFGLRRSQGLQYPLVKEYTLNYIRDPTIT